MTTDPIRSRSNPLVKLVRDVRSRKRADLVLVDVCVVGRGGASTVHEVAVTGTPSVLVPWAASADDHQTDNVRWLSEVGGTVLLPESQLSGLAAVIDELRSDPDQRAQLSAAARGRGEISRSGALARLIERVAVTSTGS